MAETIKFTCGNCNYRIGAPPKYAGKKVRCPQCKEPVRVPGSPPKPSAQEANLIKFRCPSCNQKIGVDASYAGKHVKCSKCKNPLQIPQVRTSAPPPAAKKDTDVLRAGADEPLGGDGMWGSFDGGMNDLLFAEENSPAVEQEYKLAPPDPSDEASGDEYFTAGGQPIRPSETAMSPRGKKTGKKNPVMIIAIVAVVVLLAGVGIWSLASGGNSAPKNTVDIVAAQEFAEKYIRLLESGDTVKAAGLHDPEIANDVFKDDMVALANLFKNEDEAELECVTTVVEKPEELKRVLLQYSATSEKKFQTIYISVVDIDGEFKTHDFTVFEYFGPSYSIGSRNSGELETVLFEAEAPFY